MSEYQEFTGKSVEEAIKTACDQFGVGLGDLDFEILTPGSRGVLGMGAEPARIIAAPRSALGGSAPKREAAEATPLPAPRPREDRPLGDRDRDRGRGFGDRDRGPRSDDRGPRTDDRGHDRVPRREDRPDRPYAERATTGGDRPRPAFGDRDRGPRRDDRGPARPQDRSRGHDR